jgi:hypothetical protein
MTAVVSPLVTTNPRHVQRQPYAPLQQVAPDMLRHAAFVNTYTVRRVVRMVAVHG